MTDQVHQRRQFGQFFTPSWAARELFSAFFSDLGRDDVVLEPTCGSGQLLAAVPAHVQAYGVEIDQHLAAEARARTGRKILAGNVLDVSLPPATAVFGNPPFRVHFLERLLDRLSDVLAVGRRAGLIVPAYFLQAPTTVARFNARWTIAPELIPRTLFPRLSQALVFAIFERSTHPHLVGMRLFAEALAVDQLRPEVKREMTNGEGTWRAVVLKAMRSLGGEAHLSALYAAIGRSGRKVGAHWQAKVRQVLQLGGTLFRPLGAGHWRLIDSATATQ